MAETKLSDATAPPKFDPQTMALRGRIGAYAAHARHDTRDLTSAARRKFLERFELEVDPHGELPEHERERRAEAARRAYFAKLAAQSAAARKARR